MLDAFIIDQIRKREEQRDIERPVLELPLPSQPQKDRGSREEQSDRRYEDLPADDKHDDGQRGVIVIDFA